MWRPSGAEWMEAVRLTRMRVSWAAERRWRPGFDLGVTVRGAFGLAFTDVACLRPPRACEGCELTSVCLIPTWYEPNLLGGHDPRPFSLDVRAGTEVGPDEPFEARFTWIGGEVPHDAVLAAVERAGALGFGAERVPHRAVSVVVEGDGVGDVGAGQAWPAPGVLWDLARWPSARPGGATLQAVGRVQTEAPGRQVARGAAAVFGAMIRRVQDVAGRQGVRVRRWPDPVGLRWLERRWVDAERYSQRQGQTVDLSGWAGALEVGQEAGRMADLLAAVEVLQLGRHTSCGMGVVRVEWV